MVFKLEEERNKNFLIEISLSGIGVIFDKERSRMWQT